MRLTISVFGREVLAVTTHPEPAPVPAEVEPVYGPPFGFTGSAGGHLEHAYQEGGIIVSRAY